VILRWGRYLGAAYRPMVQLPYTVSWAVGLTALFACVTGAVSQWRPDAELAVTAVTLVVTMLLIRAMDDIRDLEYDRRVNPGRPLPSGLVRERDLVAMVALGYVLLLAINLGRGGALALLVVQMAFTGIVVAVERLTGWPHRDRIWLQLAINMPILVMLSLYVYAGFLRAEGLDPSAPGLVVVAAVTIAALCMELGRKATRRPRTDERTYVTVLGPSGTSFTALAAAVTATTVVLVALAPWEPGAGWGWLVLLPLLLPLVAVFRFASGALHWPILPTIFYIPAMYTSFLVVGWLTKGSLG
jgi:4-hydroxybenzoate polyprenyltransferase